MVAVAALVDAQHEKHGLAQHRRGAHRAEREDGRLAQEVHHQARLPAERSITQDAQEDACVETLPDAQHGLDMAKGNDLGLVGGVECLEHGTHLARVLLVHGHGDLQARPLASDGADGFEAAEVRAHEKGTLATLDALAHQLLTLDGGVVQVVALIHQVETVENDGGEVEHLAPAIGGHGLTPQHTAEVVDGMAARAGGEQKEIKRNAVKNDATNRAAQA